MTRIFKRIQPKENQDSLVVSNDTQSKKTVFSRQPYLPKNFFQHLAKMLFQMGNPESKAAVRKAAAAAVETNIKNKTQVTATAAREKIQNNSARSVAKALQTTILPEPAEKLRSEFRDIYKFYLKENTFTRKSLEENEIEEKVSAIDSRIVEILSDKSKLNAEALIEISRTADDIRTWMTVMSLQYRTIRVGQEEINSHQYFTHVSTICLSIEDTISNFPRERITN